MEILKNSSKDLSNPYILHYSHSLNESLVSQILIGKNYMAYSRVMTISLSTKNKLGFVDGSITKP